jgi:hypothetical protein
MRAGGKAPTPIEATLFAARQRVTAVALLGVPAAMQRIAERALNAWEATPADRRPPASDPLLLSLRAYHALARAHLPGRLAGITAEIEEIRTCVEASGRLDAEYESVLGTCAETLVELGADESIEAVRELREWAIDRTEARRERCKPEQRNQETRRLISRHERMADDMLTLGDLDTARTHVDAALRLLDELGEERKDSYATPKLTLVLDLEGALADRDRAAAERCLDDAWILAERTAATPVGPNATFTISRRWCYATALLYSALLADPRDARARRRLNEAILNLRVLADSADTRQKSGLATGIRIQLAAALAGLPRDPASNSRRDAITTLGRADDALRGRLGARRWKPKIDALSAALEDPDPSREQLLAALGA